MFQVISLFGLASVIDFSQAPFQLNASHTALSPSLCASMNCHFKVLPVMQNRRARVTSGAGLLSRLSLSICAGLLPTLLPLSPYQDFSVFPERFFFSRSRSFMRALCNCDLLFPIEHPTIEAISLCS